MRSGWILVLILSVLPLRAQDLPVIPLSQPEGMVSQAAFDLGFDLARADLSFVDGLFDPPSAGWLAGARQRLGDSIADGDAQVEAMSGPVSRAMAERLGGSLFARSLALGQPAMFAAAERAVAIERQLSANARVFGAVFPDTGTAAAIGVQTSVLGDVLFYLQQEAEQERGLGLVSPTPAEVLAFRLAQAGQTGDLAASALRPLRLAEADPFRAAQYADIYRMTDLAAAILDLQSVLDQLGDQLPDPDASWASQTKATGEFGMLVARLIEERADLAAAVFPRVLSVSEVQDSLRPDEAVVLITDSLYPLVFAVTDAGFLMRPAASGRNALIDAIGRMREATGQAAGRSAVPLAGAEVPQTRPAVLRREAAAIYRDLLGPVAPLIADRLRLLVAAPAALGLGFPFEMLLTAPAPPGAEDRDLDWLVKRHAVQVLPALELVARRAADTGGPAEPAYYVGFGDPDYALPSQLGRENDNTRLLASLRPLPDSAGEVAALAASFGPENGLAITGADASELAVIELSRSGILDRMTVVHFATHGLVWSDSDSVGEPLLAFTPLLDLADPPGFEIGTMNLPRPDGALTAGEIRQLRFAADLVVLSACSSVQAGFDANGLSSLGAAFLAAGAGQVLGTHWPVYSAAAVEIVTGMVKADATLSDPGLALRQSLLAVIAQGGRKADPAWWAAFSIIGTP